MKLGINSYNWISPFTNDSLNLISKAKEIGFDVFEMATEEPEKIDLHKVLALKNELGIDIILCGVFGPTRDLSSDDRSLRESTKDYVRWCVDAAQLLGSDLIAAGPAYSFAGKRRNIPDDERKAEWKRSVESMKEMGKYAGDHGIKIGLEPINRFEVDLINTVEQLNRYLDDVDSPYVGMHLDTFHMNIEEKDSEQAILNAGSRLFHMHTCESDRGIPGTGQVHWDAVARGLKKINYRGACVIESFTPETEAIAAAVCLWRPIAPSQDAIALDGYKFLRSLLQ